MAQLNANLVGGAIFNLLGHGRFKCVAVCGQKVTQCSLDLAPNRRLSLANSLAD